MRLEKIKEDLKELRCSDRLGSFELNTINTIIQNCEKIDLFKDGLSYNFNKFMHPEVKLQDIIRFFEAYEHHFGLKEVNIIYHVDYHDILYFHKAVEEFCGRSSKISKYEVIEGKDGIMPNHVVYTLSNGKDIILTDCTPRMYYNKRYKLADNES